MAAPLTVKDFTDHRDVLATLSRLKSRFHSGNPLIISDVLDPDGHQYVHMVQKGGGVLGVALVGYTYVLEKMGIRFLKQAGTSAGAINTALLTVIGNRQEEKSERVLQAICDLDFFALVDGHPVARRIIKSFITDGNYLKKIRNLVLGLLVSLLVLLVADFVLMGLQLGRPQLNIWARVSFILTGVVMLAIAGLAVYARWLFKKLKNAGYGINPGEFFHNWIRAHFKSNGVNSVSDLEKKASAPVAGMYLRYEHPEGLKGLDGSVSFITSELCSKNKIQLPEMCALFRCATNKDELDPAGFVRASMSIPLFFESFLINDIPVNDPQVKEAWLKHFDEPHPPSCARFVDGGILSNFPLSLFYNPKVSIPRLPVLGIDLDDSTPGDKGKNAERWSFMGYFSRMFYTVQNHSDKEFLLKNKVYARGVGKVRVAKYNWLNFFMPAQKKIELFVLGAKAAADFLESFDWETYKNERTGMQEQLTQK